MKVFFRDFICLQFVFVIFWQKEIGVKVAYKILVKLALVERITPFFKLKMLPSEPAIENFNASFTDIGTYLFRLVCVECKVQE